MAASIMNDRVAILRRLIDPDRIELTPEGARFLLTITFPKEDQDRVHELSAKAREGTLTDEEGRELDDFIHVGDLLSIWHSKARLVLKQTNTATVQC